MKYASFCLKIKFSKFANMLLDFYSKIVSNNIAYSPNLIVNYFIYLNVFKLKAHF